jgi:septal ring factor EnvC (AmiA/AmiB activator)
MPLIVAESTARCNLIELSVRNAEGGVSINQEVLKNLEEINEQVKKVGEVMAEIAAASEQQTQGVDQVNSAVEQMNQITQQTAANAEESAGAAKELSGQAEDLQHMVSSFQLSRTRGSAKHHAAACGVVASRNESERATAVPAPTMGRRPLANIPRKSILIPTREILREF